MRVNAAAKGASWWARWFAAGVVGGVGVVGVVGVGCASGGERVSMRNDAGVVVRVGVVPGGREGLAPTGVIAGEGAYAATLEPGETWEVGRAAGDRPLPMHSPLSATTVLVRRAEEAGWVAFQVARRARGPARGDDGREILCVLEMSAAGFQLGARDRDGRALEVRVVDEGDPRNGTLGALVRRWMSEMK